MNHTLVIRNDPTPITCNEAPRSGRFDWCSYQIDFWLPSGFIHDRNSWDNCMNAVRLEYIGYLLDVAIVNHKPVIRFTLWIGLSWVSLKIFPPSKVFLPAGLAQSHYAFGSFSVLLRSFSRHCRYHQQLQLWPLRDHETAEESYLKQSWKFLSALEANGCLELRGFVQSRYGQNVFSNNRTVHTCHSWFGNIPGQG